MYKIERILGLAGSIIAIVSGVVGTIDFIGSRNLKELPEHQDV